MGAINQKFEVQVPGVHEWIPAEQIRVRPVGKESSGRSLAIVMFILNRAAKEAEHAVNMFKTLGMLSD